MDTLASLMEVKLDIREKRTEIPMRTWTRCYIKIEAIKSFPCYLKITFHKNILENEPGLVLRINIPGLEIYPVKSRTKPFTYGLYWKQNRKQCIAFLSLDSRLSMEAHMKWLEWQIQNLEQYRKEILQSSRYSRMTQSFISTEDSGIYQNIGEDLSRVNRGLNDALGPLPNIPINSSTTTQDSDKNWSRRMSGMSGIYEEITDPCHRSNTSAIYEEMKLSHATQPVASPPPLPPRYRKRLDTDCSNLHRSYTSPESDYLVNKKKWNIFDNMFGKGSKRSPVEPRKKRNNEKLPAQSPRELQLLKTKRNSFSSPDLTHLYCPNAADNSFGNCENCSFDQSNISSSNSYELENVCEEDDLSEAFENVINISQQIRANFEPPSNNDMSRVNLVGSGFNLNESNISVTSPPGYLEMKPGKGFDMNKVEELDKHEIQNDILYRLKYSFDSPITYKREFDYDSLSPVRIISSSSNNNHHQQPSKTESLYVPMNVGSKFSPNSLSKSASHKNSLKEEHTYVPMNRYTPALVIHPSPCQASVQTSNISARSLSTTSSPTCENNSSIYISNMNKRLSIDDKIASYYPNYDVPARLRCLPQVHTSSHKTVIGCKSKTSEHECVKATLPTAKGIDREKSCSMPIPFRKAKRFGSFNTKSSTNSLNDNNTRDKEVSKKYATIARITSRKFNNSESSDEDLMKIYSTTVKKSDALSPNNNNNSIKRFSSLSKFKKFDFSPLRLKITNVLQRHNSGSC